MVEEEPQRCSGTVIDAGIFMSRVRATKMAKNRGHRWGGARGGRKKSDKRYQTVPSFVSAATVDRGTVYKLEKVSRWS